jgi:hypothetical protein
MYPKNIDRIIVKSNRQSIRLLQTNRRKLEKELVSIDEFCHCTGLKYKQVERLIVGENIFLDVQNLINNCSINGVLLIKLWQFIPFFIQNFLYLIASNLK